jgi:hypothetical protein
MAGAHENLEHAEHSQHAAGHNRQIALMIAILALFLAFSETLGKSAQTAAISLNVEASNLWAFFQAKTIRMTTLQTAADTRKIDADAAADAAIKAAMAKQIDSWRSTAGRYNDEPETGEGRKQLAARAKQAEDKRDTSMAKYHHYEVASAAFQIGIVLCSAAVITGMVALAFVAGGLAVAGLGFMGIALFAPHAVHLF